MQAIENIRLWQSESGYAYGTFSGILSLWATAIGLLRMDLICTRDCWQLPASCCKLYDRHK